MMAELFDKSFMRQLEALDAALMRLRGSIGEGITLRAGVLGQSEFRGNRPYSVGDDLRRLDWNAYGRLGRLYIREFEPEQTERLDILVDTSRSMATGDPCKHIFARRIAAAFAFLALKRGSSAAIAGSAAIEGVSRFGAILDELRKAEPTTSTTLGEQLTAIKRAKNLVVISDFLEDTSSLQPLQALGERGCSVTMVQVLSPDELEPSPAGQTELHSLEDDQSIRLPLSPANIVLYQRELEAHLELLGSIAARHRWLHAFVESDSDLHHLFVGKLLQSGGGA
ncbi:DUF58 domain-containing protein [Planctomycetota bacterium]|nr:DUF58 domain-containing protein [Planctomycetota bacterium]